MILEKQERKEKRYGREPFRGIKKAFGKVKNVAAKMIKPMEGIFSRIFKF